MAKQIKTAVVTTPVKAAGKAVSKAAGKATQTVAKAAGKLPKGKQATPVVAPAPAVAPVAPVAATPAPAATPVVAKQPGQYGVARSKDLPWCAKKAAVFAGLVALNATSPTSGVSSKALAAQSGVDPRYCRHYVYHGAAAGLTGVATVAGVTGHALYITPAGVAMLASPPVVAATPVVAPVAATPAPVVAATLPAPAKGKGKGKKS